MNRIIFQVGKYIRNETCVEIKREDLPKILETVKANPKFSNAYIDGDFIRCDVGLTSTDLSMLEWRIDK